MQIRMGVDPELFVKQTYGGFISAHTLLPGTKKRPHLVEGGAIQVDGVAAEFNTFPVDNPDDFVEVINLVRGQMSEIVIENAKQQGFGDVTLVAEPTAWFDPDYFDDLPSLARVLGCEPDYNAYTGDYNTPPETSEPFRTGSGHLHISWSDKLVDPLDPEHFMRCRDIVRQLDTILFPKSEIWDSDRKRRSLYGAMGSFRPKAYGVEYRPLSNAYLRSDDLIRQVFTTADYAVRLLLEQNDRAWEGDQEERMYG